MTQLFEQIELPRIEKIANETKVSSNSEQWVNEVHQELLEQHPYIATMDVVPHMDNVNGEQGYGLGTFIVRNKHSMSPIGPGMKELMKKENVGFIRIPILISDWKVKPFDIMLNEDGDTLPLNETRVRSVLYRPNLFDTSEKKRDRSSYDRIFLPEIRGAGEYSKTSSDKSYVLEDIAQTIDNDSINKLAEELKDDCVAKSAGIDPIVGPFLEFIDSLDPVTPQQVKEAAQQYVEPDVVQVIREGDYYRIKAASTSHFNPQETVVDYPTAVEAVGRELVKEANENGAVTVTSKPVVDRVVEESNASPVTVFGQYRVKGKADGEERVGWVFPEVRAFDGTRLPLKVFSNGDTTSIQQEIVGSIVGTGVNLNKGPMEGFGVFYRVTEDGSIVAFEPVEMVNSYIMNNAVHYEISPITDPANTIHLVEQSKLRVVQPMDENGKVVAIPDDLQWMPLGEELVILSDNEESFQKLGSADVLIDGKLDHWNFSGPQIEKISSYVPTRDLNGPDAMFTAMCVGLSPEVATHHLAKCAQYRQTQKINGCRECVTPEELEKEANERALTKVSGVEMPYANIPIKEALHLSKVAIDDNVDTIDRVLSIGFLNASNLQTFAQHLPDFESTVKRLAGLLLAVRFGQKDVDENAVKSAMESLEKVINGIKKLLYRTRFEDEEVN